MPLAELPVRCSSCSPPGRPLSNCNRSTSVCAPSRRRWRASRYRISISAIWRDRAPKIRPDLDWTVGGSAAHHSRLRFAIALPRDIIAKTDAFDIGFHADLAGEALQRGPVGAVIHLGEVEAELKRQPLAIVLSIE